ncbi:hypothetical protein BH09GEM1_BH09GEM1_14810 [soil metagenome]
MNLILTIRRIGQIAFAMVLLSAALASRANAQFTSYATFSSFSGVASTSVIEDFESVFPKNTPIANFSHNGLSFSNIGGGPLYNCTDCGFAGAPGNASLVANGNEVFRVALNASYSAVGLTYYTNGIGRTLSLRYFNAGGTVGTVALTGPEGAQGFLGVTDAAGITGFDWTAEAGNLFNTGLDDVRLGSNVSATPEPASFALVGTGLILLGGAARTRRRRPSSR